MQLGIEPLALNALYKFGLWTGHYKRAESREIETGSLLSVHLFSLPPRDLLLQTLGEDGQAALIKEADGTQNVVIEFQAVIDTIQNQRLKSSMSPDAFERIGAISSIRGSSEEQAWIPKTEGAIQNKSEAKQWRKPDRVNIGKCPIF